MAPKKEVRVIVLGARGTGKSAYVMRLLAGSMESETNEDQRMMAYISSKRAVFVDGAEILVELNECQEIMHHAKRTAEDITQADGFVLMFSVTNRLSFDDIKMIRGYVVRTRGARPMPMIIVANFGEARESTRKISYADGRELAFNFDCPFFEVSCAGAETNETSQNLLLLDSITELVRQIQKADVTVSGAADKKDRMRYSRMETPEIKFIQTSLNTSSGGLRESPSSSDVEGPPQIRAATLSRLVERATYEKYPNPEFMGDLLMTYRSFTDAPTLLNLVLRRYTNRPPAAGKDPEWDSTQRMIRLRVFNLLKLWLEHFYHDFEANKDLANKITSFINGTLAADSKMQAEQLVKIMQKQDNLSRGIGTVAEKEIMFSQRPPRPLLKKKITINNVVMGSATQVGIMEEEDMRPIHTIFDVPKIELARQLTLLDYEVYCTIRPFECLGQPWAKAAPDKPPSAISLLIKRFNVMSAWIMSQILQESKIRTRAHALERIITVGRECRDLNNFNGVMIILGALENTAIYRLKNTWNHISKRHREVFMDLKNLTSARGNYATLRAAMTQARPPLVPYLGVFLTMMVYIEDGNPDRDQVDDTLINFEKFAMLANVIKEIASYQMTPYCFEVAPIVRTWLQNISEDTVMSEDEAYRRSCSLEQGGGATHEIDIGGALAARVKAGKNMAMPNPATSTSAPANNKWEPAKHDPAPTPAPTPTPTPPSFNATITLSSKERGFNEGKAALNLLPLVKGESMLASMLADWSTRLKECEALLSSLQTINPALAGKPDEEGERLLYYMETLTKSKAVEGIVEKLLSGDCIVSPSSALLVSNSGSGHGILVEFFSHVLMGDWTTHKRLAELLGTLSTLRIPPEVVISISDTIGRGKVAPLNAEMVVRRRSLVNTIAQTRAKFQAAEDASSTMNSSLFTTNSEKLATHGELVRLHDQQLRTFVEVSSPQRTSAAGGYLDPNALMDLKEREFPSKNDVMRCVVDIVRLLHHLGSGDSPTTARDSGSFTHFLITFLAYLGLVDQHQDKLIAQFSFYHRRLTKLEDLRKVKGDAYVEETIRRDVTGVRKIFREVDLIEGSSNSLIDDLFKLSFLNQDTLRGIDPGMIERIIERFIELRSRQKDIEDDVPYVGQLP